MSLISTLSFTVLKLHHLCQEENASSNSDHSTSSGLDVTLVFINNTADDAGSVLYGGAIDNCELIGFDSSSSGKVFDTLVQINDTNHNTTSNISSDPLRICLCKNNFPDCIVGLSTCRFILVKHFRFL